MKNLEKQIVTWNREIFPTANDTAFRNKLYEELQEAHEANLCGKLDNLEQEIADIAIVAISWLARFRDKTLEQVIEDKFKIIQDRKYGPPDQNGGRFKI